MTPYELKEVFNATTFPIHTYVERNISRSRTYSAQIKQELKKQGRLIFLTGACASGKSALCQNAISISKLITINGRKIFNLDTFNKLYLQATRTNSIDILGNYPLQAYNKILLIEDFHLINSNTQIDIANILKPQLESGLKIVITSLPYKSDKAIIQNESLAGLVTHIQIQPWIARDLEQIAKIGFKLLNMQVDPTDLKLLINSSVSSPKVMQENCYNLATYCQAKQLQHIGIKEIAAVLLRRYGQE